MCQFPDTVCVSYLLSLYKPTLFYKNIHSILKDSGSRFNLLNFEFVPNVIPNLTNCKTRFGETEVFNRHCR